ncbi:MAG: DUF86 domain-containing protein [Phycisphaerales bacterium]
MLKCAKDATTIVGADSTSVLEADMLRARALVNCFTELGEAASRLTADGRARVGSVPWRQIVGMRNIVVHVYWGIDMNALVTTVRSDLPVLITALEGALRSHPSTNGNA